MNMIRSQRQTGILAGWMKAADIHKVILQLSPSVSRLAVLCDENTHHCCFHKVSSQPVFRDGEFSNIIIPPGEGSKSMKQCMRISRELLEAGIDRHGMVINLGGGVVTDLGGFVSGIYKRGIRFLHVPTSLTGMIDASIGGKTGINAEGLKNQLGLFAFPVKTIIDPSFLCTLPDREIRAGTAEIIKHSVLSANPGILKTLSGLELTGNSMGKQKEDWMNVIAHSIKFKEAIVSSDPFDLHKRKVLNLGHTLGHAIEAWSMENGVQPLRHGEAVSAGLIMELYLSHRKTGFSKEFLDGVVRFIIEKIGWFPVPGHLEPLKKYLAHDKKSTGQGIRFVLADERGHGLIDQLAEEILVLECLNFYRSLS